jgi:uncharacterized membrane protein YgdD (TMEM256/DUF423 family)
MNQENPMPGGLRIWLALAALNGLMGVAAGAFGAHAVSDPQAKEWLRTGAQYQLIHAVAALACYGLLRLAVGPANWAGWLFGVGGLVFGASLYIMAMSGLRVLGAVTPLGGVLLLAGWAVLIWGALVGLAAVPPAP